jgi:transcriptional regulator with GAF, ATPase, and Fis domain
VQARAFRVDLLARLRGYFYEVLPLRGRREDLGLAIADLLARMPGGTGTRFEPGAIGALLRHSYPLNVRELEHALVAAMAVSGGGRIGAVHLPGTMTSATTSAASSLVPASGQNTPSDPRGALATTGEPDRAGLVALLAQHHGNVAAVARAVDRAPMQVRRWMKRHGLSPDEFRDPEE